MNDSEEITKFDGFYWAPATILSTHAEQALALHSVLQENIGLSDFSPNWEACCNHFSAEDWIEIHSQGAAAGKSFFWLLMAHSAIFPSSDLSLIIDAVLEKLKAYKHPYWLTTAKEGAHKGKSALWWLSAGMDKNYHPSLILRLIESGSIPIQAWLRTAQSGIAEGISPLLFLTEAVALGNCAPFLKFYQKFSDKIPHSAWSAKGTAPGTWFEGLSVMWFLITGTVLAQQNDAKPIVEKILASVPFVLNHDDLQTKFPITRMASISALLDEKTKDRWVLKIRHLIEKRNLFFEKYVAYFENVGVNPVSPKNLQSIIDSATCARDAGYTNAFIFLEEHLKRQPEVYERYLDIQKKSTDSPIPEVKHMPKKLLPAFKNMRLASSATTNINAENKAAVYKILEKRTSPNPKKS